MGAPVFLFCLGSFPVRDGGIRVCCPVGFFRLRQNRGFPHRTIPQKRTGAPAWKRRFFCSVWGHSPSGTGVSGSAARSDSFGSGRTEDFPAARYPPYKEPAPLHGSAGFSVLSGVIPRPVRRCPGLLPGQALPAPAGRCIPPARPVPGSPGQWSCPGSPRP